MNFRRHKTNCQQLVFIFSVAISIGLYLASSASNQEEESATNVIPTTPEVDQEELVIDRIDLSNEEPQVNIFKWSGSKPLPKKAASILSDHERIYFHETTGHDSLNLRQLCAVESAAKENPKRSVQIFFQSDSINLTSPIHAVLKKYSNIAVILINASDYFADTVWFLNHWNAL